MRRQRQASQAYLYQPPGALGHQQEWGFDLDDSLKQNIKGLKREPRVDVARPQVDDTDQGFPTSHGKSAKVAIMSEHGSILRKRLAKHRLVVGANETSASRVDDVVPNLSQTAYYFGVKILVGE